MHLCRWPAIIAMLGVLLHAAALVRHHGVMLDAYLEYQELVAGLTAICHGDPDAAASSPADFPGYPNPSNALKDCPVCSAQAPTFAVAAPQSLETPVRLAARADRPELARSPCTQPHPVCPPARGPPLPDAFA